MVVDVDVAQATNMMMMMMMMMLFCRYALHASLKSEKCVVEVERRSAALAIKSQ